MSRLCRPSGAGQSSLFLTHRLRGGLTNFAALRLASQRRKVEFTRQRNQKMSPQVKPKLAEPFGVAQGRLSTSGRAMIVCDSPTRCFARVGHPPVTRIATPTRPPWAVP